MPMRARSGIGSLVLLAMTFGCSSLRAAPIAPGNGQQTADLNGTKLVVYTYRPRCSNPNVLFVFHGLNRNADGYRDHARPLGDRLCALVVVPQFDQDRFPARKYQRGGIVDARGRVEPPAEWTGKLVVELGDWIWRQEGRRLAYSMIGHSAGAQFLSRIAAFIPNEARHMVIANPSTWVLPSLDIDAPYGLRGVYSNDQATIELRRYLAEPVTVFLGQEDLGDEDRNDSPEALAQGVTRYERGLNAFAAARKAAGSLGVPLGWRLVELPGVGHNAAKMFSSRQAFEALAR
jgi:hypothetical protein